VLFQGQGRTHLLVGQASLDGSDISYPLADLAGGDQTNPDWSPDGSHMVFVVNDGARDDLWIARADGSMPRTLLDCRDECRYLDDPDWSPNGAEVVYSRTTARGSSGLGSLETVDVATGAVTMLLPPRFRRFTAGARWSPYGSYVVYESVHTASRRLDAEVDGVSLRIATPGSYVPGPPLTAPDLFAATADWSPDGTQIVYAGLARPDAVASVLFVIPAAGGEPRQVTHLADAGAYAQEPDWSGDGSRIVFSGRLADRAGSPVLLVVPADGSAAPAGPGTASVIGRHPRVEPGA
jgi:Tol biopolymer transport system component